MRNDCDLTNLYEKFEDLNKLRVFSEKQISFRDKATTAASCGRPTSFIDDGHLLSQEPLETVACATFRVLFCLLSEEQGREVDEDGGYLI